MVFRGTDLGSRGWSWGSLISSFPWDLASFGGIQQGRGTQRGQVRTQAWPHLQSFLETHAEEPGSWQCTCSATSLPPKRLPRGPCDAHQSWKKASLPLHLHLIPSRQRIKLASLHSPFPDTSQTLCRAPTPQAEGTGDTLVPLQTQSGGPWGQGGVG